MSQDDVKLIYFNIRGLAEPIRWILKIAQIKFTDERISLDAWATTSRKGSVRNLIRRRKSSNTNIEDTRRLYC